MENSKEALNKKNIATLAQNIKQKKAMIDNLLKQLETANKELEDMEKERDELQTKNTELQNELEEEKKKREEGADEMSEFISEANKEWQELEAKIEATTNYWNNRKQNQN